MRRLILIIAALLTATACAGDGSPPVSSEIPPSTLSVGATSTTTGPMTTSAPSPAEATTTGPAPSTTTSQGHTTTASTSTTTTTRAPATTTSTVVPQPLANLTLSRELVATGFEQPVFATGEGGRLYVVDQVGRIEVLGGAGRSVFLDITDRVSFGGERGLLGLAFHPDFDQNGRFFVDYTGRGDGHTVIEEHTVGGGDRVLLTISQPAANHNAGMIAFGPDGYLYIALGDGGGADDRYGNGQDPATLLGTILRIDVDSGDPYGIPPENPWADGSGPGAPEVWIYGLRNPWRFSFDGDDLFIGDVGQNEWEEVSIVNRLSRGLNLGWPIIEGNSCFALSDCNPGAFTLPALVYPHQGGACSITGGYVYRGSAIPGLGSAYFYGDFCSGAISSFRLDGEGPYELRDWPSLSTPGLTSFGVDESGEMYMSSTDGNLYRIVEG